MEPNPFDFEQSAHAYIRAIKQKGGLGPSDEAELKAHLYDTSESLLQKGLSEEEAFLIAARRLGQADELAVEYGKVNTVLVTDRIWAYLLTGFGMLTTVRCLYQIIYRLLFSYLGHYSNTRFATELFTVTNFSVCLLIWSMVKWGHRFSEWLRRHMESRPWPIILLSLVLPAVTWIGHPRSLFGGTHPGYLLEGGIAEFSYYLPMISLPSVILLLVFRVSSMGSIRFRHLFSTPSPLFIILFGVFIALVAATTRVLNDLPILSKAVIFAVPYMAGAFCIGYFTTKKPLFYIGLFSLFGLIAETWGGTLADLDRGNTIYTVYYVMAIFVAIPAGYALARMTKAWRQAHLIADR